MEGDNSNMSKKKRSKHPQEEVAGETGSQETPSQPTELDSSPMPGTASTAEPDLSQVEPQEPSIQGSAEPQAVAEPVQGEDIGISEVAEAESSAEEGEQAAPDSEESQEASAGSEEASSLEEIQEAEETPPGDIALNDQIVEAILFSSDSTLPVSKIATVVGALSGREIRAAIERLNQKYDRMNCAFHIQEIAGGFQMLTRPEYAEYLHQLYKVRSENKLSPASLETLAIIAYKQPVLRAEIEAIRGVACGETIRTLMEKDLVKIVGRAEELGRPMLYGTTKRFMQVFGLASLEDLPKVPELLPPSSKPKEEAKPKESPKTQETVEQKAETEPQPEPKTEEPKPEPAE